MHVTFIYTQFLIQCVVSSALVVVKKLLEIRINFIPLVLTHLPVRWHFIFDQLLNFSGYFVPSHYNKHRVHFYIHQFLVSHILFNVFAFDQCHHFCLFPIAMPLPHYLCSTFIDPLAALLAPLPHMFPLPTPLPPIGDIVGLSASIDEKLCISILEEAL